MKKYTILFVFALIFGLFIINIHSVSAYDSGCTGAGPYSITTGQLCYGAPTNNFIQGCTTTNGYSPITGQFCGGAQNNYPTNSYVAGCTSAGVYNIITGQLCYGTGVVNNSNNFLNQQFQIGARGADVMALQQMLNNAGFSVGPIDGIYGPRTNQAYLDYQSQYPNYNYNPNCTSNYCPNPNPNPNPIYGNPPTVSGVSGPQSLSINQLGTWTVTAYNQNGGSLSYSVNWGDQPTYAYMSNSGSAYYQTQQSATLTHNYLQAGTYTAVFTVTNNTGQTAQTSLTVTVSGSNYYGGIPTISYLSQTSGVVGTQVTIYGTGFSANCGITYGCANVNYPNSANTIYFGGAVLPVAYSYNGTSLSFSVPSILSGTYPVYVNNVNGTSNSINFTVLSYLYY